MTGIDYAQQDPRWKNILLGNSQKETMGQFGCLVVSFTEVATAFGHSVTPDVMNDLFKQHNLFSGAEHDDVNRNDALSVVYGDIQYLERKDWRNMPADLGYFDVGNDISTEIIVQFDDRPAQAGLQQHWCRVINRDGNDITIVDSWDGKRKKLGASYGGDAAKLIYAALKYHKPMAQAQVPTQPKSVIIQRGGTLWQIAVDNHTTVAAIQDLNRGRIPADPRQIREGTQILVP